MGGKKLFFIVFSLALILQNLPFGLSTSLGDGTCRADTVVNGSVAGLWQLASSPFVINDSAWVSSGQTLTIQPGVVVKFWTLYSGLTVYGTLHAEGTEQDTIRFQPYNLGVGSGAWKYITFNGSSSSNSVMRFCEVKKGQKGIRAVNASPQISRCSINDNSSQAVRTEYSSLILDSCNIFNNDSSAVVIHGGIPHIRGNHIFSNSGKGLYLEGLSGGEIEENHIESNISNGIYLDGLNGGVITGNIVENNNSYGIYGLNGCMNVDLTYNSIFDNDDEGIYLFDDCRNFEILHNIIYGNGYYGIRIKDCAVVNPSVYIKYNTIYENSYDGIYSDNSKTQVINNTIAYNLRHGVFCFNGNLTIYNNIIAENENKGIYIQNITVYPDYNDFWLNAQGDYFGCNPGFHDLNADPLFIDANAGDYNLSEGSPCIDAGNPLYIYNDPDGTRNDMGAWYFFQDIVVQPGKDEAPTSYNLLTGHPNPFNQVVDLNLFLLPGFAPSGELEIFDISGRLVNAISLNPAVTNYRWNGVDFTGRSLPSGIYICRTEFTKSLRLILLK